MAVHNDPIYHRAYHQLHRTRRLAMMRAYNQSPEGMKSTKISDWRRQGLIDNDYSGLYDRYIVSTHCEHCNKAYKSTRDRHMDHDHSTGLFRKFLCHRCNVNDNWLKINYNISINETH